MHDNFFNQPVLNSPYEYPVTHWNLDGKDQPEQLIHEHHQLAEFIHPFMKVIKRKKSKHLLEQALSQVEELIKEAL